jgi:hypothetical protein
MPPTQVVPVRHATPHPPQWAAFVSVSTHEPPQLMVPRGQVPRRHVPEVQIIPFPHALPQDPQCAVVLWRSTHAPPQGVSPAVQAQEPARHV